MLTKILVAVDGSPRASGVLAAAQELALRFGATLYPLRAITIPPEFPAAAVGGCSDPLPTHLVSVVVEELSSLMRGASKVESVPPIVRVGQPWRVILDAADELDVDLIVMGSHGYDILDRLLGTTAAKVTNSAQRNVLVVHERLRTPEP